MDKLQFWQHAPRVQLAVVMHRTAKRGIKHHSHTHPFHELGFLLEGDCNWHIGAKRERLHAGDLVLVPAGLKHHERTPPRAHARIAWIGFDFPRADVVIPPALGTPLSSGDYAAEIKRLFEVVASEQHGASTGHRERAEFALRELLILLCRLSPAGAHTPRSRTKTLRTPQVVRSAALTLAGNLAQPMRIRDLAQYHSLSASHFAVLFRRHQGETPRRFLQNARLKHARLLLETGTLTIKEIAAACGYVDAPHFCHAFKAATTLTPKAYRRNAKTASPKLPSPRGRL